MRPNGDPKADQDKKLFVGGLNPKTNEESLRNYYGQWGEITDVVVMKDPRTNKSRGFGFVTFKESMSVDKAQSSRPHKLDGKEVDSKRAMPREETSPEVHAAVKKIFVGGLKKEVTNEDLGEYFGKFGYVSDASIVMAKDTNTSRGFAFVTFDDTDSVDKVILARPHMIRGHKADVRKALSRDEMNRVRAKPPPARFEYNQGWNNGPNAGYQQQSPQQAPPPQQQQSWDQSYNQPYGGQQYNYNSGYGYGGGYDNGSSAWPGVADGFGNYQNQGYGGGPMRGTPNSNQYSRPAPYAGNGWQQR